MSAVTSRTHILPYRSDLHIYRGNQDSTHTHRDVYGTHSMYGVVSITMATMTIRLYSESKTIWVV